VIAGTDGPDVLDGLGGNDRISGGGDRDRLIGGEGDDSLDGGAAIDVMQGGAGNETYFSDHIWEEISDESGVDTIIASVSVYSLENRIGVENLTASSIAGSVQFTGNALDNVITGDGGKDWLNGAGGDDILIGGADNDRYLIGTPGDVVVEGAGKGMTKSRPMWITSFRPMSSGSGSTARPAP
jgi:Ca2+-binding RTX toxin-like protein